MSPAYVDNCHALALNLNGTSSAKSIANEALTEMLARDKCDVTKISPLYGSPELLFKTPVSWSIALYIVRFSCKFTTCCSV